ncbi:MAG TPA: hypothetical protein GXZ36_01455 [Firmicutes bacterium]|nr:hypothetical protein [Bacillota bacterium]
MKGAELKNLSGDELAVKALNVFPPFLPIPVMLKYLESDSGSEVVFIGIQPKCTEQGFSMCEEVKTGTERLVQEFYAALIREALEWVKKSVVNLAAKLGGGDDELSSDRNKWEEIY